MSDAADKAEESVRKKPAAKLTADASDDAEGNAFQTTDEEPLATAVPRSKAKPKPTGGNEEDVDHELPSKHRRGTGERRVPH